jgi:hypothetical protein
VASWWTPIWSGFYNIWSPLQNAAEILNALLPYMAPYEQQRGAQALAELSVEGTLPGAEAYWAVQGSPVSTERWQAQASALRSFRLPEWFDQSPEAAWMRSLTEAVGQAGPRTTRASQVQYASRIQDVLRRAPNEYMAAIGQALAWPTLTAPSYGQAAPMGTYLHGFRVKGGLVSNPWFV